MKAIQYGDFLFIGISNYSFNSTIFDYYDHIEILLTLIGDGVLSEQEAEDAVADGLLIFGFYNGTRSQFVSAYREYFSRDERNELIK